MGAERIGESPYDLATIVDPDGAGRAGAGDIKRDEAAAAIEEAMVDTGRREESPNDLAASVDPAGVGTVGGAGDIDVDHSAAAIEEAMVETVGRKEESPQRSGR